jgi:hypothetical protein
VRGDVREIVRHLLVDDNEDLDTFPRFPLEESIESPFLVLVRRTTKVEFGREPPIVDTGDGKRES